MTDNEVNIWDINKAMVQVLLENTIETYPPEWRLLQEPIQNSIDSFINDDGAPLDIDYEPCVEIELYIGSNKAIIRDNGKGVPIEKFSDFLILGSGSKGKRINEDIRKMLKGSQGVGIKSSVFTSEVFHIKTIHKGNKWEITFPSFCEYSKKDFIPLIEKPKTKRSKERNGTEITISLAEYSVWDFISDRMYGFFDLLGIDNAIIDENGNIEEGRRKIEPYNMVEIIGRYLKQESYAGCVSRIINSENLPVIKLNVKVICDYPKTKEELFSIPGIQKLKSGTEYKYETKVGYLDFKELVDNLDRRLKPTMVSDYKELLESGRKFESPTVFYQILTQKDIKNLLGDLKRRPNSEQSTVPNKLISNQNREQRHSTMLSRINGAILFCAPRPFLKYNLAHKSSICLSVNGLPTDITLEISGGELGYVPSTHLVLDVQETLGYGKRNLHPRSKGAYNSLVKDLWRNLRRIAASVVSKVDEFDSSISGIRFNKTAEITKIPSDDDIKEKYIAILGRCTLPETEEDIITSYFHMVGKGYLEKYLWLRLNDITIYDALSFPPRSHIDDESETNIKRIEFKRSLIELCKSSDENRQNFEDIDLCILWKVEDNDILPPGYSWIGRESDTSYSNHLPDVNYRVKHNRHSVQIICLEDIFNEI